MRCDNTRSAGARLIALTCLVSTCFPTASALAEEADAAKAVSIAETSLPKPESTTVDTAASSKLLKATATSDVLKGTVTED